MLTKPVYGRMGENIMVSLNGRGVAAETGGNHGNQTNVYQQLAEFGVDEEDYRYQLNVFMAPTASGLACRRQDSLILGDEAELVSLGLYSQTREKGGGGFKWPWSKSQKFSGYCL